jgi:MFS family permease
MLALLAVAELLGMALWFTGSAVGPSLAAAWELTSPQVGWLTTAVQLGFVLGTAASALLNLADTVPSRRLFALSAVAGAGANALLAATDRYDVALLSRLLSGVCLAGVYPPAMKMAATWFASRRGVAVGTIVGALTVGKALPYLAQAVPQLPVATVVQLASASALAAALLVGVGYRDGPHAFPSRPFAWGRVGEVVRSRRWRLATGGYLGHMAELYAFWTWIPAFLAAHEAARAARLGEAPQSTLAALTGVGVIAVGGLGCVWGGLVADRVGRVPLVTWAMAGAFGRSWWLMAPLALAWGFFVIADSAQFSVLVTESVPPHAVGTALTLQLSLGFLLTMATIQLIPPLARWVGWGWVFPVLAVGPVLGIASVRRLARTGDRGAGRPS